MLDTDTEMYIRSDPLRSRVTLLTLEFAFRENLQAMSRILLRKYVDFGMSEQICSCARHSAEIVLAVQSNVTDYFFLALVFLNFGTETVSMSRQAIEAFIVAGYTVAVKTVEAGKFRIVVRLIEVLNHQLHNGQLIVR